MFNAIAGALAIGGGTGKSFDLNGVKLESGQGLKASAVHATSSLTSNSLPLGLSNGCVPDESFTASSIRK